MKDGHGREVTLLGDVPGLLVTLPAMAVDMLQMETAVMTVEAPDHGRGWVSLAVGPDPNRAPVVLAYMRPEQARQLAEVLLAGARRLEIAAAAALPS